MKKNRQYRSNQGRSPRQMRNSYIGVAVSGIGLIICFLIILLSN